MNLSAAIAQAKETLKLSQPTPNIEAFVVASEVKVVNLKQNHDVASHLESFANVELEALAECFHYVKLEYIRLWDRLHNYYDILEDSECAFQNNENLIARAKTILAVKREYANGDIPPELAAERSDTELVP